MKIHTKIVYQFNEDGDLIPIKDEYFEYEGPIASCDPVSAAVSIGGSAVAGYLGAEKAEDQQYAATQRAAGVEQARLDEETRRFNLTRDEEQRRYEASRALEASRYNEMAPYRTAGIGAVKDIEGLTSGRIDPTMALQKDPGFQFRLSQGNRAIDRFLSARGNRLGGSALKESIRYNQNFGSNEYQNYLNNKFKLAGFSGQPGGAPGSVAPSFAGPPTSSLPDIYMAQGKAQAEKYGSYTKTFNDLLNNAAFYKSS